MKVYTLFYLLSNVLYVSPSFESLSFSLSLSVSFTRIHGSRTNNKGKKVMALSEIRLPCSYDAKLLISIPVSAETNERTNERTRFFISSTRSFFKSAELASIMNSRVIRRTVLRVCASLATGSLGSAYLLPRAPTFPLVTLTLFGSVLRAPRSRFTTSCKK